MSVTSSVQNIVLSDWYDELSSVHLPALLLAYIGKLEVLLAYIGKFGPAPNMDTTHPRVLKSSRRYVTVVRSFCYAGGLVDYLQKAIHSAIWRHRVRRLHTVYCF